MAHLSDWHEGFDVEDRDTYPQVMDPPVELRFANGFIVEFDSFRTFIQSKAFSELRPYGRLAVSYW
jgi:hypothetical protein